MTRSSDRCRVSISLPSGKSLAESLTATAHTRGELLSRRASEIDGRLGHLITPAGRPLRTWAPLEDQGVQDGDELTYVCRPFDPNLGVVDYHKDPVDSYWAFRYGNSRGSCNRYSKEPVCTWNEGPYKDVRLSDGGDILFCTSSAGSVEEIDVETLLQVKNLL
eukprot:TRINITY_DN13972_c0_g1_i1.p1 TRINITY_DN13972_c0_g1~~TRINITY_DN13972_c0_g1_i1.p1  ORF type:complete len:163 (+),score=15.19 TRINITY_DN13972_c0_g1_i1:84-572(+)